jgi:hypothetical protein
VAKKAHARYRPNIALAALRSYKGMRPPRHDDADCQFGS